MQAVLFDEKGNPYHTDDFDFKNNNLADDEVLVEMKACSFNPVDLKLGQNILDNRVTNVMGTDISGKIIEVGKKDCTFNIGDRVFGTGFGWKNQGTYAEYVKLPMSRIELLPDSISYKQGAAAAMVFCTALLALENSAGISTGDVCLVEGGSGGVGHAAIQIANLHKSECIATCNGNEAEDFVKKLGARPFDYHNQNVYNEVSDFLNYRGIDIILENNLADHHINKLEILNPRANLVCIGQKSPLEIIPKHTLRACLKNISISYISIMTSTELHKSLLSRVGKLFDNNHIEVNIHEQFQLHDIDKCMRTIRNDQILGKVVLSI